MSEITYKWNVEGRKPNKQQYMKVKQKEFAQIPQKCVVTQNQLNCIKKNGRWENGVEELLPLWEWCMFYVYTGGGNPALGLFGTMDMGLTICGSWEDGYRWKFNSPAKACIPPPPWWSYIRRGLFHITEQGLARAHQTPLLLLTQAHLVPNNPEEGTKATLATSSPKHTHTHICTSAPLQITSLHIRSNFSCDVLIQAN